MERSTRALLSALETSLCMAIKTFFLGWLLYLQVQWKKRSIANSRLNLSHEETVVFNRFFSEAGLGVDRDDALVAGAENVRRVKNLLVYRN